MSAQRLIVNSLWLTVCSLILLLFTIYYLPSTIYAADTLETDGTPLKPGNYKPPQHTDYTTQNLFHASLCQMVGFSPAGQCLVTKSNGEQALYNKVPGGAALGAVNNMIAATYTPPTSSVEYLADLGRNFGFAKPAYAQVTGSGAGIISPVFSLWKTMRNISYVGFILIFLVVGFMIMFRQKINPQTVISVQNALPGIVIGLALVYFSYFVSALMVDTAFVGIPLVSEVFAQSLPNAFGKNPGDLQKLASESSLFQLFLGAARPGENFGDIHDAVSQSYDFVPGGAIAGRGISALAGAIAGGLVGGFTPLGLITGGIGLAAGALGPEIISLLVPVILIIALIFQFFRLLFKLINAYITILVMTIIGPILIMFSSIPGRGGALSLWWKTTLANALIFPAVFAAFLFAGLILGSSPDAWVAAPPLFGGFSTKMLRLLIAYGIVLGTPAIPDMVKEAMGVKDIKGIPQEALAGVKGAAGAAKGLVSKPLEPYIRTAKTWQDMKAKAAVEDKPGSGIPTGTPKWYYKLFR